jgi:hypothetical protein
MITERHRVEWHGAGRKAQLQADPDYPHGISVNLSDSDERSCQVILPYPAPECGYWQVTCSECGFKIAISAAGRADDPTDVTIACRGHD